MYSLFWRLMVTKKLNNLYICQWCWWDHLKSVKISMFRLILNFQSYHTIPKVKRLRGPETFTHLSPVQTPSWLSQLSVKQYWCSESLFDWKLRQFWPPHFRHSYYVSLSVISAELCAASIRCNGAQYVHVTVIYLFSWFGSLWFWFLAKAKERET